VSAEQVSLSSSVRSARRMFSVSGRAPWPECRWSALRGTAFPLHQSSRAGAPCLIVWDKPLVSLRHSGGLSFPRDLP
jgi:hypothetical protein